MISNIGYRTSLSYKIVLSFNRNSRTDMNMDGKLFRINLVHGAYRNSNAPTFHKCLNRTYAADILRSNESEYPLTKANRVRYKVNSWQKMP